MPITLALETSTPHGSVALHDGERLLFAEEFVAERGHSARLFPLIEAALKVARPQQIAAGLGPGSYAGIRIAIASALGLQMALEVPLVGVPSVAALAETPEHYVAVGDARRGTFYWTEVNDGLCVQGPKLLEEAAFRERLAAARVPLCTSDSQPIDNATIAFPTAVRLAQLAARGRGITQRDALEPIYLREAHITWPKQL